jgi:hypothetical protein
MIRKETTKMSEPEKDKGRPVNMSAHLDSDMAFFFVPPLLEHPVGQSDVSLLDAETVEKLFRRLLPRIQAVTSIGASLENRSSTEIVDLLHNQQDPDSSGKVSEQGLPPRPLEHEAATNSSMLSELQRRFLVLSREGHTDEDIAQQLGCSVTDVALLHKDTLERLSLALRSSHGRATGGAYTDDSTSPTKNGEQGVD